MFWQFRYVVPLLFISGCGSSRRPSPYRPVDENGVEIINAFTIAADWMMYFGAMAVLAGILMIVFLKMVKTGGISIIAGVACFAFAQVLNYIGAHIALFTCAAAALTGLIGFLYYKAVTTSLPWAEKMCGKDFNRDGIIGFKRDAEPIQQDVDENTVRHNEGFT